ncbi:T9SS type A sorting domain-containing protein [Seonamhaeicola marinus]|uniref:T9SS type A sorting domain-containing protein n=1 Tax=Seonamhaeicola marinus TaxID=1912246 RepID=UPI0021CF54CF|nr:T9SS type A sorting domain-containing protein [Seonamhaeicola marinus]
MYPNPTSNEISIKSTEDVENIKVYSASGILIKSILSIRKGELGYLNFKDVSSGMYFLKVLVNGKEIIKKVIIN